MAPRIPPESAALACLNLIGIEPDRIEYPGGKSRCSVRAVGAAKSFVVTRRKHAARAALEAGVLSELHAAGAPVPAVLAFDGEWLIQQDLGERRLSAALGAADVHCVGNWAARAAAGLLLCQRAAQKAALWQRVAPIGVTPEWLAELLSTPGRVAGQLGVPDPDIGAVIRPAQLTPRQFSFVKWDARPGNALLLDNGADDGGAAWIDWEHCGARDALDDLAWLLCDEYMPDMRLFLVLKHKGEGAWWNPEACERTDRIGVTAQAARRLCARGARWSGRWPGGAHMSKFFADADKRLRDMSADSTVRLVSPAIAQPNTPAPRPAPH